MLDDFYPSDEYETDGWEAGLTFSQPNDVVRDPSLTTAQKRAILASWASDARAVADAPSRRQLDDGTMLDIDDILDALKQFDREQGAVRTSPLKVKSRLRHRRAFRGALRYWGTFRRDDGDDDDPPPCPATARVPRLTPSLSGGAAVTAAYVRTGRRPGTTGPALAARRFEPLGRVACRLEHTRRRRSNVRYSVMS